MNHDELQSALRGTAGAFDPAPLPTAHLLARVRGNRRRNAWALGVSAALLVGGVVVASQFLGGPPTPLPPAHTPVQTDPSQPPETSDVPKQPTESPDPSQSTTGSWSTPIAPACGDVISDRSLGSALAFADPPQVLSPTDSFPVTVRNEGTTPVITEVDRYDFAVPVLTEPDGTVVAVGDLAPVLAEGYSVLAIAPGDELTASATLRWTPMCDSPPLGDQEADPVRPGTYDLYLLATTGPFEDPRAAEQIQGGPFPVEVDPDAVHEVPPAEITGAAPAPECGQSWPRIPAGLPGAAELLEGPHDPGDRDGLATTWSVTLGDAVSGADVHASVLILDGDRIVGPRPAGTDNLRGWYASTGLSAPVTAAFDPVTCAGEPLPPGEYDLILTVNTLADSPLLAVSERVPFTQP